MLFQRQVCRMQNNQEKIRAPSEGVLKVSNQNLIEDSKKELIVMGRNTEIIIEKNDCSN